MTNIVEEAVSSLKSAAAIRLEITKVYVAYRQLQDLAKSTAAIEAHEFKRAVDAHYYKGGWPYPNSKGRMEAFLDNFVSLYRVLDFIGSGNMLVRHLSKCGITVSLADEFKIPNRQVTQAEREKAAKLISDDVRSVGPINDLKTLISYLVDEGELLQGKICQMADHSKGIIAGVQGQLKLKDAETDRLFDLTRTAVKPSKKNDAAAKVAAKRDGITQSVSTYSAIAKKI